MQACLRVLRSHDFERGAESAVRPNDVLGRGRRCVRVVSLDENQPSGQSWTEALSDNRRSPVPDQVAFRIDFPVWLDRQNRRDRKLAEYLAVGNIPTEAARRFRISCGRVSQLRGQLQASWEAFHSSGLG